MQAASGQGTVSTSPRPRLFVNQVVLAPLRRGEHEVTYSLAPDLFGDNKIVNADDETPAKDSRIIAIDPTPEFDRELFED